jgi:hypothetical protein
MMASALWGPTVLLLMESSPNRYQPPEGTLNENGTLPTVRDCLVSPTRLTEPMAAIFGRDGGAGVEEKSPRRVDGDAAPVDAAGAEGSPFLLSQAPTRTTRTRAATTAAVVERADRPVGSLASSCEGGMIDSDTAPDGGMAVGRGASRRRSSGGFHARALTPLAEEVLRT